MLRVILPSMAVAFLIEGLVEYVLGTWWKPGDDKARQRWIPIIDIVLGIGFAIGLRLDLLTLVGVAPGIPGQILTGIAIGRGSQYLHSFVRNFLTR